MKQARLFRQKRDEVQVSGNLEADSISLVCLEKLSTLIPEGTYLCKYTRSTRLSALALKNWLEKNPALTEADCPDEICNYKTYELQNVIGREGIRIHACNFSRLLDGCIAPGLDFVDIDGDGEVDAASSKIAVQSFEKEMNYEDFQLTITNNFNT